jgi:gluconolactonase
MGFGQYRSWRFAMQHVSRSAPCAIFALLCTVPAIAAPTIERLDPRLDSILPQSVEVSKVADGFSSLEGPVWRKEGGYLLFSDIPGNAVYRWRAGLGLRVFLKPSGYSGIEPFTGREPGSNGLAFDGEGRLVLCEHGDRRVTRLEADGRRTVLADRYDGKRLNSPNDLAIAKNDDVYFTDPPFGLPQTFNDPSRELPFSGVYRRSHDGPLALLTADLPMADGVALSPSERVLYVSNADPQKPVWWAYDLGDDGTLHNGRVFFDATAWVEPGRGSADGTKVDKAGNVYGAGPNGMFIIAPDGTLLGRIRFDVATSNSNWGEDGSTLFVTASTAVYRVRLTTGGFR